MQINESMLATNLADIKATEIFNKHDDVLIFEKDGDSGLECYTDYAQAIYDALYDEYYNLIAKCKN